MIVTGTTSSLQAVAFPQFCRIRGNPEELKRSILSCFRVASMLSIPALVGLAVISKPLLSILGTKWADASTAMVILCLVASFQPIFFFTAPLLQAVSKPHYLAVIEWGHAAMLAGSIALAGKVLNGASIRGQVTGIAATRSFISIVFLTPFIVWIFQRFGGVRFTDALKVMMPSILAAVGTALVVLPASLFFIREGWSSWLVLGFQVALGGGTSLAILMLLDSRLRETVRAFFAERLHPSLAVASSGESVETPQPGSSGAAED
jgi:O-antigen/teichoic acid export membrane protein